jgi:GntR family transcriptional regulator, galactonate operon transcriptional repressor
VALSTVLLYVGWQMTPSSWDPSDAGGFGDGVVTHSRRGLHGRVVDILGQRVISGELTPGTVIEPDRLVADLQVSRTVVREVIKVLTAKGLLDARPRTGTFVLPRGRWNLLDADVIRWRNADSPDARLLKELEEVRQIIEPWGARLAAQRRTDEHLAALDEAFDALANGATLDSRVDADADVRFHRAVLAAAGNELLERVEGLLEPVLRARDELAFQNHDHGTAFLESHRLVLEHIRAGDGDQAFEAMSELLRSAAADTDVNLRRRTSSGRKGPTRGASKSKSSRPAKGRSA